jgi:hypothetical protein
MAAGNGQDTGAGDGRGSLARPDRNGNQAERPGPEFGLPGSGSVRSNGSRKPSQSHRHNPLTVSQASIQAATLLFPGIPFGCRYALKSTSWNPVGLLLSIAAAHFVHFSAPNLSSLHGIPKVPRTLLHRNAKPERLRNFISITPVHASGLRAIQPVKLERGWLALPFGSS